MFMKNSMRPLFNLQFMMYTSRFFLPSRPPEALLHGLATARIIDTATKNRRWKNPLSCHRHHDNTHWGVKKSDALQSTLNWSGSRMKYILQAFDNSDRLSWNHDFLLTTTNIILEDRNRLRAKIYFSDILCSWCMAKKFFFTISGKWRREFYNKWWTARHTNQSFQNSLKILKLSRKVIRVA